MAYKSLPMFTTSSDALGCYATPIQGAQYWRGKVGIVRGVSDASNRLNPLMRVEFEWDIEGGQLPRKETWSIPLLNLGHVRGFLRQIRKAEEAEGDAFLAEFGSIDMSMLGNIPRTCKRCGSVFETKAEDKQDFCPLCVVELHED